MRRRRYLQSAGVALGALPLAGCAGLLPPGSSDGSEYPGGTLVVENDVDSSLAVRVRVRSAEASSTVDTDIPGGKRVVREAFASASTGETVTLAARIGTEGEPITFEFLPAGGENAPPEVARLTVANAVEESAT